MPKLHIIIFCLNRPILCENLLQSILNNFDGNISITLLFGATDEQYEKGFELLFSRFPDSRISYIRKFVGNYKTPYSLLLRPRNLYYYLRNPIYRETKKIFNFKSSLEKIIRESECDLLTFLTDDSFFFRKVNWNDEIANLVSQNSRQNSFSFRHGMNIRNLPNSLKKVNSFIKWNYMDTRNDGHWSYRFSIDGHIYDRRFLLPFIKRILYINPNTFEGVVCRFAERNHFLNTGFGFEHSVLAGAEINRVQNVSKNNNLGIDNNMLNLHYLKGYLIKLIVENEAKDFRPQIHQLTLINGATNHEISLLK